MIGVIVNQVRSARIMFEQLRRKHEALLLTGRIRPYDRDRLLEAWLPRIRAGRERSWDGKAFVIATQTIEVGANVDFDALVTEAAPLDALRQRFGRLDRLGRHGKSEACIMLRNRARASPDPVYGDLPQETWRWLKVHARRKHGDSWVDFGVKALNAVIASITGDDVCPHPDPVHAPVLFPSHLDLWAQTHPRPHPDPEVAPFLHGLAPQSPDVQVVWRADLKEGEEDLWRDIVALVPPRLQETLPIPIAAVRAWLHQLSEVWVSDLEGLADTGGSDPRGGQGRVVLRWRGPESELVTPDRLVPGDTVVVPAAWGGADAFGWHPDARTLVPDIAEFCIEEEGLSALPSQRSLRLRLQPEVWVHHFGEALSPDLSVRLEALLQTLTLPELTRDLETRIAELLDGFSTALLNDDAPRLRGMLLHLQSGLWRWICYPGHPPRGLVLVAGRLLSFTDEDDSASLTRPVPLAEHGSGVAHWARRFGECCGLPEPLVSDLVLAAELHDLGKAEARFQVFLHGGDELAAAAAEQPLSSRWRSPAWTPPMSWQRGGHGGGQACHAGSGTNWCPSPWPGPRGNGSLVHTTQSLFSSWWAATTAAHGLSRRLWRTGSRPSSNWTTEAAASSPAAGMGWSTSRQAGRISSGAWSGVTAIGG